KPKGSGLTITTTLEERAIQVQEDSFEHFVEVKPFPGVLLKEGQYYVQNLISGACVVLDRKVPKSKVIKPTSTPSVASAIASSAAKTVPPQLEEQFGALDKDEWDPEEKVIEQLQQEVDNLYQKFGKGNKQYQGEEKKIG
ncbi:MAG: hypothetical protein GY861_10640, partial [bacterium]|nr:hypothetical protein [bacterium]